MEVSAGVLEEEGGTGALNEEAEGRPGWPTPYSMPAQDYDLQKAWLV